MTRSANWLGWTPKKVCKPDIWFYGKNSESWRLSRGTLKNCCQVVFSFFVLNYKCELLQPQGPTYELCCLFFFFSVLKNLNEWSQWWLWNLPGSISICSMPVPQPTIPSQWPNDSNSGSCCHRPRPLAPPPCPTRFAWQGPPPLHLHEYTQQKESQSLDVLFSKVSSFLVKEVFFHSSALN